MALIRIPLRNDIPSYEFKIDLDGTTYTLGVRYNTRKDRWIMDFRTENNEPVISGTPLLNGVSLLARYQEDRLPPGELFMLNTEDENVEADRDSLTENAFLLYQEAA